MGVSLFFVTCVLSQLVYTFGGSGFEGANGSMMIEVVVRITFSIFNLKEYSLFAISRACSPFGFYVPMSVLQTRLFFRDSSTVLPCVTRVYSRIALRISECVFGVCDAHNT